MFRAWAFRDLRCILPQVEAYFTEAETNHVRRLLGLDRKRCPLSDIILMEKKLVIVIDHNTLP